MCAQSQGETEEGLLWESREGLAVTAVGWEVREGN